MPAARHIPFVTLLTLLERRFPGLDDPARLIKEGAVLVNGLPAQSGASRRSHPSPRPSARSTGGCWPHPRSSSRSSSRRSSFTPLPWPTSRRRSRRP